MPKKGSNIYKRKDGRWEARYEKSREPNGRICYGYCYGKTYKEAKEKANEARISLVNGRTISVKSGTLTVGGVCLEWLEKQKNLLKQSTIAKYDFIIRKHIEPNIGHYRLAYLNSGICESFKSALLERLSAQYVRDILTVLKAVISFASANHPGSIGAISFNLPKKEYEEMRVLSVEEQRRFTRYALETINGCNFGILLAVMTGMRIGEVCALRWKDISIEEAALFIKGTLQRVKCLDAKSKTKTEVIIGPPKSAKSYRVIPLTTEALNLCLFMEKRAPESFILTGDEHYMEPRALQYRLEKLTKACMLEGVHFHTLRHTFATRCVEVGFEIKSLSEILGHSTTKITLDKYVHSSMKLKRDNMEKLSILG